MKDIERGSPADRAGLQEMDRLVAVDGEEVQSCSHEQVVDKMRQRGNACRLLVVDKVTDQMYKLVSHGATVTSIQNADNPHVFVVSRTGRSVSHGLLGGDERFQPTA